MVTSLMYRDVSEEGESERLDQVGLFALDQAGMSGGRGDQVQPAGQGLRGGGQGAGEQLGGATGLGQLGVDGAGEGLGDHAGVGVELLGVDTVPGVQEGVPLPIIGSRHGGQGEGGQPPDGEPLVLPGQLLVSQVDLLVDKVNIWVGRQGLRDLHQVLVELVTR